MATEDVTAGTMDSGSEDCDAEVRIAGVTLGVTAGIVLFPVDGGVGAVELSVDTGTTETPLLEVGTVLVLEVMLGPVDGPVPETLVGPTDGEVLEIVVGPVGGVLL